MNQLETVAHWQRGAKDSFEMAQLAHVNGKYALAMFHCHLAVEKALKAEYIRIQDRDPPTTHNLLELADMLKRQWTADQKKQLDKLTELAILARYGDHEWETTQATKLSSMQWLSKSKALLSVLL